MGQATPVVAGPAIKPVVAGPAIPVVIIIDRWTMKEGQVELVIPVHTLNLDITVLIICFIGDVRVSRRYAGEPTHELTFLVMRSRVMTIGWQCLALEVKKWRYTVAERLAHEASRRNGLVCDLCQSDRKAKYRGTVGFLDLLLYKKRDLLPNTVMVSARIARDMRFEDKNICWSCSDFVYSYGLRPCDPPRRGLRLWPDD